MQWDDEHIFVFTSAESSTETIKSIISFVRVSKDFYKPS